MTDCKTIMNWFNERWPERLACSWDNVGLLAGRQDKPVRTVYVALDATDEAVDAAVSLGADLLLNHHPLIFGPMKRVTDQDAVGRRLLKLLRADISYYAGHTSFDIARGGMADLAAEQFGAYAGGWEVLEETGEQDGIPVGVGTVGNLQKPMTVRELALLIKEQFQIPAVTVYSRDPEQTVTRAAISPGSGKGMAGVAGEKGAQVLITGDMGHHDGLDLMEDGLSLIDAGHYGLEHIFVDAVTEALSKAGLGLEVHRAVLSYPSRVY